MDEDNDGRFPDDSAVEIRYPRKMQEEQGDRSAWPWLPASILSQCGPDEWYVCVEARELATLDDDGHAPDGTAVLRDIDASFNGGNEGILDAAQPDGILTALLAGPGFGGASRYEREETAARAAFEAEQHRHAMADAERRHHLAGLRAAYDQAAATALAATQNHNASVDQFERDFLAHEPEAVAEFCTLVLDSSAYPEGFAHRTRALYRPEPREVAVEYELPLQSAIPAERGYKYVANRDEIDTLTRPEKEIKDRYARLIAQAAIRTIHEILISIPPDVTAIVTFYGHVSTTDRPRGSP